MWESNRQLRDQNPTSYRWTNDLWSGWVDSNHRLPAPKAGTLDQTELHPVVRAPTHGGRLSGLRSLGKDHVVHHTQRFADVKNGYSETMLETVLIVLLIVCALVWLVGRR